MSQSHAQPTSSPAAEAKAAGLKSLRHMAQISNVKERTLYDMFKNNRPHFDALALGCAEIVRNQNKKENL